MAAHKHALPAPPAPFTASRRVKTAYSVLSFVGLLLFALALMKDPTRAWASYLVSYFYFVSIALGALFFTAIQHASNAGWSVVVRRFMESMTSFLPIGAIATIPLLFGAPYLYEWMNKTIVEHDPILLGKSGYLNMTFFVVRLAIFFGAWILFQRAMVGNSLRQDKDGHEHHSVRNYGIAIGFLLVFAISYSLFAVDTVMSLQPHWYSTIWGVYCFAGMFQAAIAVTVIITGYMIRKGYARGWVNLEHLHDLAKYMKAFTVFYAYIGFSQFLLIWYANLPEETIFYLARSSGGWMAVTLSLLIFKFAVPFLLLLPRAAKRSIAHTTVVACLILFMEYIDIHWMVYPNFMATWEISWQEIGTFIMFAGLFLYSITSFFSKNAIVPIRDPRLDESLTHHVIY